MPDLTAVDWDSLSHCYGPASEVPDLLRALRAPDAHDRADAEHHLVLLLEHQGSRYEASAAAVPYLIEILTDACAPDRLAAYRLLYRLLPLEGVDDVYDRQPSAPDAGPTLGALAYQRSEWWITRRRLQSPPRPEPEWLRTPLEPDAPDWQLRTYDATRAGIPTYLHLLDSPEAELRCAAAHLLGHFPQQHHHIAPVLAAHLSVEPHPSVAAVMCVSAGLLGGPPDARIDAMRQWLDHPDPLVHWAALIGLGHLGAANSAEVLTQLCDCVFDAPEDIGWMPFCMGSLPSAAADALNNLPVSQVSHLVDILLDRVRQPDEGEGTRVYLILRVLLSAAFPEAPLPDDVAADHLTDVQRLTLRTLLNGDHLPHIAASFRALGECNLPRDEEALAAWLSAAPPGPEAMPRTPPTATGVHAAIPASPTSPPPRTIPITVVSGTTIRGSSETRETVPQTSPKVACPQRCFATFPGRSAA